MNPELSGLLELADQAGPGDRIDYCNPIARFGDEAVAAVSPWLSDSRLSAFAVRVVSSAARHGTTAVATTALLAVVDDPITPSTGDDLVYYLDRLDPTWRKKHRAPRVKVDSPIGKMAKDPMRPRQYMHAWNLWHRIIDRVPAADSRLLYLSACHRWNSDDFVNTGSRRIKDEPPAGEYCFLCDQAESRTTAPASRGWTSIVADWEATGPRLHLQCDRTWHLALTDDAVESDEFGAIYVTECGWWIESDRMKAAGRGEPLSPVCEPCIRFVRARDEGSSI